MIYRPQSKEKADLLPYIDEPTVYDIFHQNPRWLSFGTVTSEHLVKQIFGTPFLLCITMNCYFQVVEERR